MKKFNLEDYKKKIEVADTPLKPNTYVEMNDALKEVLGLPGLPLGHVTQVFGLSDSGKTSLVFHAAAEAQKQNVLPIFICTEGKVSWDRAKEMGLDAGNCIIEYATYLEDIFKKIDRYLADLGNGSLPTDIMIFVDSIGNTLSVDSVTANKDGTMEIGGGMMKAARTLREQMRVYSHRINDTRKMSSPYTAGLVFINHAYKQPPAFPGGPTTLVPYGGDGIYFASSLVLRTQKKQRLTAVHEGRNINYGIVTKLTVDKNHISNISNAGEFVITSNSIIPNEPEALKEFKDANKVNWNAETVNKDE